MFFLLLCCSMLIGCWDKVEIEDRMIVGNICFDTMKEEMPKGTELDFKAGTSQGKYLISFTAAVPSAIKENKAPAYKTYNTIADNLGMATWKVSKRYAQFQYFGHAKTVIFGEDVLKNNKDLKVLLDSFIRGHEFNKSMDIFVTEGNAADVVEVVPKFDLFLVGYIQGIADNEKYIAPIQRRSLDQFIANLVNSDGDAVIPKISGTKDEVLISGGGIIKDYTLVGYIDDYQSRALRWMNNEAQGGIIDTEIKDIPVSFRYYDFKRRIKLEKVENGKIYLSYNMETEGSIEEFELGESFLDDKLLRECEVKLQKIISDDSQELVKILKEKYKVDVIGVREYLGRYEPALYEEIEKDFDTTFTDKIEIKINAKVKVRRVGTMR